MCEKITSQRSHVRKDITRISIFVQSSAVSLKIHRQNIKHTMNMYRIANYEYGQTNDLFLLSDKLCGFYTYIKIIFNIVMIKNTKGVVAINHFACHESRRVP